MKYLALALILGFSLNLSAQQRTVKKHIESNSTMVEEDSDDNSKVKFEIKKEIVNGKEVTSYLLEKVKDGEKTITQWDGQGEMPKDIKAQLEKSENIDLEDEDVEIINEKQYEIEVEENGKKKIIKWNGEGEMPAEMERTIEEHDIEISVDEDGHTTKTIKMKGNASSKYNVKVRMGVGLQPSSNGVKVDYVEEGMPAQKAGIRAEDIILKVNQAYIFTDETLMKELAKFNPGDKVKVTVLRGKTEKTLKMTLVAK